MKLRSLIKLMITGSACLIGVSAVTAGVAQAGDVGAGRYAFATCSGCHAIAGYTNAYPTYHVPRLGGQKPDYIVAALIAYKEQQRDHETMHANAASLSTDDMANIAAFLASFESTEADVPVYGDIERGMQKAAACSACHGEDGNGNAAAPGAEAIPRLAGQFQDYLEKALYDYRSGARQNAVMQGMASVLTDKDIRDISAYFANQSPALAVIDYSGQ